MTISRRTKAARWAGVLLVALAPLPWLGMSTATASPGNEDNVTICHRTNAVTNPYRVITVDPSAIDGKGGADHFGNHLGPVFDPEEEYPPPHNGDQWGDIIPPLAGVHDGLNWDEAGIAIWENDCQVPGVSPSSSVEETPTTEESSSTEETPTTEESSSSGEASPTKTKTKTNKPVETSDTGEALPTETEKGRNSESAAAAAAALPKTGSGLPVAGALGASLLLIGLGVLLLLGPGRLVPVYHRRH
jgi:hypothetical protein